MKKISHLKINNSDWTKTNIWRLKVTYILAKIKKLFIPDLLTKQSRNGDDVDMENRMWQSIAWSMVWYSSEELFVVKFLLY